jgi:tetratricopeptide (TPR) repeat protein
MSESTNNSSDVFKNRVAVIMAILAALVAVIAFLQSDAGSHDNRANRDSKRYATEALGRKVSGQARVNFDYNAAYQNWYELDLLANSADRRDEAAAAQRYRTVRDKILPLSPLLTQPYFDVNTGQIDVARYEADTYLVEITALTEKFVAASNVKDAWDAKANTYIVHLTLLAVALFMFGLAITISTPVTRKVFVGAGSLAAIVAVGWAGATFFQPVIDRREQGSAIDAYARGFGLAHQARYTQAIDAFDGALSAAPDYGSAYAQRAEARFALGEYEKAAADYEQARANGDESTATAGNLGWTYYLLSRFDDAIKLNRETLAKAPDELWIRFNQGVTLLAAGQIEAAKTEYQGGMEQSARQVAAAKAAKEEPPYLLWWSLDMAAVDLADLTKTIDTGDGLPAPYKLADAQGARAAAQDLIAQLKSLSVGLEFSGQPPARSLTATISPFQFGEAVLDSDGNPTDEVTSAEEFAFGTQEVLVVFDYEGMQDGQEVIFKVFIDGEEDPSWRLIAPWDLGASGSAQKPLSLSYSDAFVLSSGEYEVDMFVDGQLAQRGKFTVLPE